MARAARRGRAALVFGMLALVAVLIPGVYAVQITLVSENVARVGGTGGVSILAPTAQVDQVTFTLENNPPYYINGVNVVFTPNETGTYTVAVNIYDAIGNILGSGIATGLTPQIDQTTGLPTQMTVYITLTPSVDPAQAAAVEVIVLQETIQ